jgi:hypothetical protein
MINDLNEDVSKVEALYNTSLKYEIADMWMTVKLSYDKKYVGVRLHSEYIWPTVPISAIYVPMNIK